MTKPPTRLLNPQSLAALTFALGALFTACGGSEDPPDNGSGGSAGSGSPGGSTGKAGSTSAGTGGSAVAGTGGAAGSAQGGGGAGPTGGKGGSATAGSAGSAGSVAGAGSGSGGAGAGGTGGGTGGSGATGGAGTGGTGGDSGGSGGSAGKSGGFTCPDGLTGAPTIGTPARVASVPPADDFNMNNGNFGNVEGPVWLGDALYVSEMSFQAYDQQNQNVKRSRILRVTADGQASVHIADSGSNGIATDGTDLIAAVHKDGSITRYAQPGGAATVISGMFMNARFNSPNDLTIHSTGTIYFTDPNFQAPNSLPQAATRVYRIPPGGEPEPIPNAQSPDQFGNPNGITLSLEEDFLYVAAQNGRRYPVMPDGTLGTGQDFAAASGGDGMVIDCAGNLYVTKSNSGNVVIYDPSGTEIDTVTVSDIQAVTNVAFGGADNKTLYITGLGNNKGLFSATASIPGRPY